MLLFLMAIPPNLPASLQIANSNRKSSEQTVSSVSPTLFCIPQFVGTTVNNSQLQVSNSLDSAHKKRGYKSLRQLRRFCSVNRNHSAQDLFQSLVTAAITLKNMATDLLNKKMRLLQITLKTANTNNITALLTGKIFQQNYKTFRKKKQFQNKLFKLF